MFKNIIKIWQRKKLLDKRFDFLFNELSAEGTVIMGPEPVMQLRLVSWLTDKFGVTWQLVWE